MKKLLLVGILAATSLCGITACDSGDLAAGAIGVGIGVGLDQAWHHHHRHHRHCNRRGCWWDETDSTNSVAIADSADQPAVATAEDQTSMDQASDLQPSYWRRHHHWHHRYCNFWRCWWDDTMSAPVGTQDNVVTASAPANVDNSSEDLQPSYWRRHHHHRRCGFFGCWWDDQASTENANVSADANDPDASNVGKFASRHQIPMSAAQKINDAFVASDTQGLAAFQSVGLNESDLRAIVDRTQVDEASIARVDQALGLKAGQSQELLQGMTADFDAQAKDVNSPYWQACIEEGTWKTPQNAACQNVSEKGCSPQTGATYCY